MVKVMEQNLSLIFEVKQMLSEFNQYFAYLRGKQCLSIDDMPTAAIMAWAQVYSKMSESDRAIAKSKVYCCCQFHPTPQSFYELARGSTETEALNEWVIVLDALRMNTQDGLNRIQILSHCGRCALRLVGGLRGLGETPESYLHSKVKDDFVKTWKTINEGQAYHPENLPSGEAEGQASAIVEKFLAGFR